MKAFALLALCCLSASLAACGGSGDAPLSATGSTAAGTTKTRVRPPGKEPIVVPPKAPPSKGLVVKDLKVGTGPAVEDGDRVTAEYVGYDYRSGEQFDNHAHLWGHGEPAVFTLGAGEVIRGWDLGVKGMKMGGRRELIIPPHLAYGNVSPPPEVGPNETVIFVVELLGIG